MGRKCLCSSIKYLCVWSVISRLYYGAQNATTELGEALFAYGEELKRAIELDVSTYFDELEEYDPPRYKIMIERIQFN